ncbi:MAG: hypothetical protein NC225_04240 [Clostridium sp.]|nr:hypothetical protein [Clostridium sp.]MCM1398676.1 hypothetical protein [Clostridium sp.]MCM1458693.1 hypothetical protein [Bacteroides sp.]
MIDDSKLVVDGYIFRSKKEFERAKKEYETVHNIMENISMDSEEEMVKLYSKLVTKKYFQTPVGLSFLHDIRQTILDGRENASMPYIPVVPSVRMRAPEQQEREYRKLKDQFDHQSIIKSRLTIAVVAMAVIIVGMIFIVMTNDNVGYFNAEEKVINKYSMWQEQLDKREEELDLREEQIKEAEKNMEK